MGEIRSVLRRAAIRVYFTGLLRALVWSATACVAIAIILRLVERTGATTFQWNTVWWALAAAAGVCAVAWPAIWRPSRLAIARKVDEGAGLREAISTALCVSGRSDAWSRATLAYATEHARRVNLREATPVRAPRHWHTPLSLGLALMIVWFAVPQWDLFGSVAEAEEQAQQEQEIAEAKQDAEEAEKVIAEALRKAGLDPEDAKAEDPEALTPEPKKTDPDAIRRAAVRKLSNATERLESLKSGERAQQLEAMTDKLRKLRVPGDGPLTELSKKLAQGDFKQAQAELNKLLDKASSGEMNGEQSETAKRQMEQLAQQLEKLAQDQAALERALKQAGLDPQMAQNPAALEQAIQKSESLTQEQKDALQQMAQCSQCSGDMAQAMAQAMSKMASGMSGSQGMSEQGMEGAQGMASQLSEMEMLSSEMASVDAALSQARSQLDSLCQGMGECQGGGSLGYCEGGNGQGQWAEGISQSRGQGTGGPGMGEGGSVGEQAQANKFERTKVNVAQVQGAIIGSRLIQGEQIRGDAKIEFANAVRAANAEAADAMENNVIPPELRDAVKAYYAKLNGVADDDKAAADKGDD